MAIHSVPRRSKARAMTESLVRALLEALNTLREPSEAMRMRPPPSEPTHMEPSEGLRAMDETQP